MLLGIDMNSEMKHATADERQILEQRLNEISVRMTIEEALVKNY